MTERRAGQDRKSVNLLVKLTHSGVDEFVEKYATNLSPGGMFIRSRDPKPIGTPITFRVEIAGGLRVLQGKGVVKWVREPMDGSGPPGMGVEFSALDASSQALVTRMLTPTKASAASTTPKVAPVVAPVIPAVTKVAVETPEPPASTEHRAVSPEVDFDLDAMLAATPAHDVPPPPPGDELDIDVDTLLQQTPPPPEGIDFEFDVDESAAPPISTPSAFEATLSQLPRRVRAEPKSEFPPLEATVAAAPTYQAPPALELDIDFEVEAPAAAPQPPPSRPTAPARASPPSVPEAENLPEIRRVAPQPPPPAPSAPVVLAPPPPRPEPMRGAPGKPIFLEAPATIEATGPVVGIDLGTTNSCCAVLNNGKPYILKSKDGYNTIPSIVALGKQNQLLVGNRARSQMLLNPGQSIYGAKRLVGRDFDSETVKQVKERFHYDIVAGPDGKAAVALGNSVLSLEEVQGIVLKECKAMAEQHLGQTINRAVITCPAYYSEQQREAVRKAAAMAGLKVERVLNEPTAAALAYGLNRELSRKVLVYDLGGGTFDATLMRIDKNVFEVLATGGDIFLGGLDFDNQVVDVLLTKFQQQNGTPFAGDPVALSRVSDQAERAKIALSERATFDVHLPMLQMTAGGQMLDLKCTLTREELNASCLPLVERTIDVVRDVLLDASIKAGDVDDVILVGGMSRMPLVREKIKDVFKKPPQASVNADEAVALGAALYSGTVDKVSSVVLIDVVPMTIGLGLPGGSFKRIIERNTPLPASKSFSLATTKDNEEVMELQVFQGEDANISGNEYLGTLRIEGLPKAPKGAVQLAVTLKLDSECVLLVDAKELRSRKAFTATLATRYTPDEIRKRLGVGSDKRPSEAASHRADELKARAGRFWGFLKRVVGRA